MRSLILVLAMTALGTGCTEATTHTATTDSQTIDIRRSPIAVFLGADGEAADAEGRAAARADEIQDRTATCMAEEGFAYLPPAPSSQVVYDAEALGEPEWGSREWVKRYGFGVSTQLFAQSVVGSDLVGINDEFYESLSIQVDPNRDYLDSLTPSVREAFDTALFGESEETSAEGDESDELFFGEVGDLGGGTAGCQATAERTVYADDPSNQLWGEYGDELQAVYERIDADPSMIEAVTALNRCVAERGYSHVFARNQTYTDPQVAVVFEMARWATDDLTTSDWEAMSSAEIDELAAIPPVLSNETRDLLRTLQGKEIETAVAVYECGRPAIESLAFELQIKFEQEFLDSHESELGDWQP